MNSSQVSLARMILNISTPVDQGLSLNKGEILQGLVQSIKDGGLLTLLLKGRMIEAVTQVPVKTGEELFLQVDGFRDGRVYLKVLTPVEIQQAQRVNLASSLLDMGITPGKDNLLMAQMLLDNNLPVTTDNLASLSRAAVTLGGADEKNLQAAAFALSRGIVMDPKTLPAVKQLLNSNSNLARIVESLFKNIDLLEGQAAKPESYKGTDILPRLPLDNVPAPVNTHLDEVPAPVNTPGGAGKYTAAAGNESAVKQNSTIIPAVNTVPGRELNHDLEVVKPQVSPGGTPAVIEEAVQATGIESSRGQSVLMPSGWETDSSELIRQLPLAKELLEQITVRIQGGPEEASQKLENKLYYEKDILRGIMVLEEIVNKEIDPKKNSLLNEFLNQMESLDRELGGTKIFNFTSRVSTDNNINCYYFSVPVQVDEKTYLCELRLNKEPGKKSLKDMEHINLVVGLETGKMGRVIFHVNWQRQGYIELQGVVENSGVQNYLEANLDILVNSLEKRGYKIKTEGIKVAETPDETQSLKSSLSANTEKIKTFSIDITI